MQNSNFQNMAEGLADIQAKAYEMFGPQYANSSDWMEDQIRKCAFFDLIDSELVDYVDEMYNAHYVAEAARKACGIEDVY